MFDERIGFMASLGFALMPAERVVAELRALGYGAVEWTAAHFNPRTRSAAELKRLISMAREGGLFLSEVVVQQDYVTLDEAKRADRIAYTLEAIAACAEASVTTVNLFTGPAAWDETAPRIPRQLSFGTAWGMVEDAYGQIVAALERHRVHGAVEGVFGMLCNDYATTRLLIDHFDSPWLGVNFDPSHGMLKSDSDAGWVLRQWGKDRIKHVHIKDAVGVPEMGRFLFPFPGEGDVDWKGMFAALVEIGYEGWLSVDFESFAYHDRVLKGDTCEAARRCMADVRALLAL
jgi:D-psicose/D-tagatose/L-ribulose 3-epimerase